MMGVEWGRYGWFWGRFWRFWRAIERIWGWFVNVRIKIFGIGGFPGLRVLGNLDWGDWMVELNGTDGR